MKPRRLARSLIQTCLDLEKFEFEPKQLKILQGSFGVYCKFIANIVNRYNNAAEKVFKR